MHPSLWLAALLAWVANSASAGSMVVPADISVSLTAEPNVNLVTGQPIHFTITATNHGPGFAQFLAVSSSEFVNEFDLNSATAECVEALLLAVGDTEFGYFYYYDWYVALSTPLHPGQTRTCHLTLPLSASAPDAFTFTWAIPEFFIDNDPSNNSASVILRRATAAVPPATLPTLSVPALLALAGLLLLMGRARLPGARRKSRSHRSIA
jgi:hypothetical protein